MAGGKLTPRQKMINMMYLVLTALLALNVAKEVLEAFNLIAHSLEGSAAQLSEKNHDLGKQISTVVEKELKDGNDAHKHIPPMVDEVSKQTDDLIVYMDGLIASMYSEEIGGRDEETGKLKKPDEVERNYRFWMFDDKGGRDSDNGGRGAGKGYELREKLNAYAAWANELMQKLNADSAGRKSEKEFIRPIAVNFNEGAGPKDPTNVWEYKIFHNVPVAANVAMLQKFKTDINVIESQLFEELRKLLLDVPIVIDSLVLKDAPNSRVVAAGGKFVTELFVTTSSSQAVPSYSGSGAVAVNQGGQTANLTIAATLPPGVKPGDCVEKAYNATARVPTRTGKPKVLNLTGKYFVCAPILDIDAKGGTILYEQCCNDYSMKVIVPGATEKYEPQPVLAGGNVQKINANDFRLIPGQGNKAKLQVFTTVGGTRVMVGEREFQVTTPPLPLLVFFKGSTPWDGKADFSRNAMSVGVAADQDFRAALPKDANYQLLNVNVYAKVGPGPLTKVGGPYNSGVGGSVQVRIPISTAVPRGATVTISVESCIRVTCSNQRVGVKLPPNTLSASARLE